MAKVIRYNGVKLDLEKAIEWLDIHWQGKRHCAVCGNTNWGIFDEVVEMRAFNEGRTVVGGSIFPHLAVVCNTCGNTLLFNAILAGLVESPK